MTRGFLGGIRLQLGQANSSKPAGFQSQAQGGPGPPGLEPAALGTLGNQEPRLSSLPPPQQQEAALKPPGLSECGDLAEPQG